MCENKTPAQIVASANSLARLFYAQQGYEVPEGSRFDKARHPQERLMWNLACLAYEEIEGTEPEAALDEMGDDV
jgi:hypothetical protein